MTDSTADFPHLDLSILTEREELIIQLHYADGWSLRRIARAIGCHHKVVQASHRRALECLAEARACNSGAN